MPPKKRVHSSRPAKKKTGKTLVKRKTRKKSPGKRDKTAKQLPPDILNPAAMENLHYIAYNAPEALEKRGFGWTGAPKKKGKKKGKRGKKIKKK